MPSANRSMSRSPCWTVSVADWAGRTGSARGSSGKRPSGRPEPGLPGRRGARRPRSASAGTRTGGSSRTRTGWGPGCGWPRRPAAVARSASARTQGNAAIRPTPIKRTKSTPSRQRRRARPRPVDVISAVIPKVAFRPRRGVRSASARLVPRSPVPRIGSFYPISIEKGPILGRGAFDAGVRKRGKPGIEALQGHAASGIVGGLDRPHSR